MFSSTEGRQKIKVRKYKTGVSNSNEPYWYSENKIIRWKSLFSYIFFLSLRWRTSCLKLLVPGWHNNQAFYEVFLLQGRLQMDSRIPWVRKILARQFYTDTYFLETTDTLRPTCSRSSNRERIVDKNCFSRLNVSNCNQISGREKMKT
jgi:hypothetical protein